MKIIPAKVEYNGREYFMELGTIESTHLGYEDHGIFSLALHFEFGGSGQAAGPYALGSHGEYTGAMVKKIIETLRVHTWEGVRGRQTYVLREEEFGLIRGIMSLDSTRAMLFSEPFIN